MDIKGGVVHEVSDELTAILISNTELLDNWQALTPLARNEWLCWLADAKKSETKIKRTQRLVNDILAGKKRPCCWPGCSHRNK